MNPVCFPTSVDRTRGGIGGMMHGGGGERGWEEI